MCFCGLKVFSQSNDTLYIQNISELGTYVTSNIENQFGDLGYNRLRLITPFKNIYDIYSGKITDSITSFTDYLMALRDIDLSNKLNTGLYSIEAKNENILSRSIKKGENYIAFTIIENNKLKDSVIINNYLEFTNNRFLLNTPSGFYPFEKDTLFIAAILGDYFDTKIVKFYFRFENITSNLDVNPSKIEVDFDDSNGFRNLDSLNEINYSTNGTKTITFKIYFAEKTYYAKTKIKIAQIESSFFSNNCDLVIPVTTPDVFPTLISTNKLGTTVYGKYAVWFSSCNSSKKIRKPYIICAGYNPGNGKKFLPSVLSVPMINLALPNGTNMPIPYFESQFIFNGEFRGTFYESYNGSYVKRFSRNEYCNEGKNAKNGNNLLDRVRDEGYDVIILANDNGEDVTINNAALLIELIEKINTQKMQNGYFFENVVTGFSAGAITARLALALMESRYKQGIGPHPHTKLFVSIEGEHQGANIPLGFQQFLRFQKNSGFLLPSSFMGLNSFITGADFINKLITNISYRAIDSDNANELLINNAAVNGNAMHQKRAKLITTFSTIPLNTTNGYPQWCRKVSIAQGPGINNNLPLQNQPIFESNIGTNLTKTAVSHPSTCGGSYTWVGPSCEKKLTARWWNTANTQNVFDGRYAIDASFTYFPLTCINSVVWGCQCTGPFTFNIPIVISNINVAKPNSTNFDEYPSSTQSAQMELFDLSAYPFYNTLLGGANAQRSLSFHSFTHTASALDLHDPNNGYSTSPTLSPLSLNLLYKGIDPSSSTLILSDNKRYGFPHLSYPINHYQVTPFDGIYAIGENNGTFSNGSAKPYNQLHVEDAQEFIGDYLARLEVAPEDLVLTNRKLGDNGSNYTAEFEARKKIFAGKESNGQNIYAYAGMYDYLDKNDDFIVGNNSSCIIHSGDDITFLPGFEVKGGSELHAYIEPFACNNALYRLVNNNTNENSNNESLQSASAEKVNFNIEKLNDEILLYPNPANQTISISSNYGVYGVTISDLFGKIVFNNSFTKTNIKEINLEHLSKGVYIVKISAETQNYSRKLIID